MREALENEMCYSQRVARRSAAGDTVQQRETRSILERLCFSRAGTS
jgi:hypothetical protein